MDEELIAAAISVRAQAYAPYSKFAVGAAVRSMDGRIFTGVNVENVSYGLTICAERTAIVQAVAAGKRQLTRLVVATDGPQPSAPCGACLQVMAEFDITNVILCTLDGLRQEFLLSELLPHAFHKEKLLGRR
jgi:cytidine deaminase